MNYSYKKLSDCEKLFEFYNSTKGEIPYWFDVDYDVWYQSMFQDTDYESTEFFHELNIYVAYEDSNMVGFIQFGIPNYIYKQNGEKSFDVKAGIIRNLYFDVENAECGFELVKLAEHYFDENSVEKKFAFFHAFGMTCNAGHGKLYCSLRHIEEALKAFGYQKEHENVYYKRLLTEDVLDIEDDMEIRYSEVNEKGLCGFSVFVDNTQVGAGEIVYLPQETIAYLKWIYIKKEFQQKGYASKSLKTLFANLYQKGIRRFDTDTADGNVIAQKLYEKNGFENMGRTRSYLKNKMIEIKETDICGTEAMELLEELNTALARITGSSGEKSFDITDMQDERSIFVVAYMDGVPMGCGAIREMAEHTAEIKRVYARPNHSGVAHELIACLERKAIEKGFHELKLETRKVNKHAVDFYIGCGYVVTENYGKYIGREDAICFCKKL